MANEFKVHKLNDLGFEKAEALAREFEALLSKISLVIPTGRERAIVVTKLQEACYFAKMALAMQKAYQAEEE